MHSQPGFFQAEDRFNREPDYADPDWFEQVNDWEEYWNHTRWDLENEEMDDGIDVAGTDTRTVERASAMINAMRAVETRPEVLNVVPSLVRVWMRCVPS
jgi:hypothetical protein